MQPITSNRAPLNDVTTLMGYMSLVQRLLTKYVTARKNATDIWTLLGFYALRIFWPRKEHEITHRNATAKCSPLDSKFELWLLIMRYDLHAIFTFSAIYVGPDTAIE
jgi:hypothetical protein